MNIRCLLGHKWKRVCSWIATVRFISCTWDGGAPWSADEGRWYKSGHKCTRCGARRK